MKKLLTGKLILPGLILATISYLVQAYTRTEETVTYDGILQASTAGELDQITCINQPGTENCHLTASTFTSKNGANTSSPNQGSSENGINSSKAYKQ